MAWTMSYAIDQQMIQRFKAAKTQKTAQVALLLNIPGIILLISFCCFTGLVLYANFSDCDPLNEASLSGVKNPNQLLPYFVMLKFNTIIFIPGLFLSSIFCASLSSVSSALNSMSACIWRDYLLHFKVFKNADDRHSAITTKVIALVCGLVCIAMAFLISKSDSNLIQISSTINGALQAPIIGIFFVSSLFPMMNIYGLYAGALSGFGIGFWIGLGSFIVKPNYPKLPLVTDGCFNATTLTMTTEIPMVLRNTATNLNGFDQIYGLSYMWLSPLGVLTVIIVGVLVSFVTNFFIERRQVHDSLILYRYKACLRSKSNESASD